MPSDMLGDPVEQMAVVEHTFPDVPMAKKQKMLTPKHDKAFNRKPVMAQISRIQQPK